MIINFKKEVDLKLTLSTKINMEMKGEIYQ